MSFFLNSSQLYNIWDFEHAGHFNFESVFSPEGDFEFPIDSSPVVARLFRLGGRLLKTKSTKISTKGNENDYLHI